MEAITANWNLRWERTAWPGIYVCGDDCGVRVRVVKWISEYSTLAVEWVRLPAASIGLGAQVIGVDANESLLETARTRHPEVRFEKLDLGELTAASFGRVDGVWASFVAAYFSNLESTVARWSDCLVPGGWLTLVEMDDLFAHQPLPSSISDEIREFYAEARAAGRYDFQCGRRLSDAAKRVGLTIAHEGTLADDELCFQGPAAADVLEAWRFRLHRMGGLKAFFGPHFPQLERSFLHALAAPDHQSQTRVFIVVAQRPWG